MMFDLNCNSNAKRYAEKEVNSCSSNDLFVEWNLRLLRSFFTKAFRKEEVFLRVDKDFFNQIGQDIGGDLGFLSAVREGPKCVKKYRFINEKALELVRFRKYSIGGYNDPGNLDSTYFGVRAPNYLPYLAALVRNFSERGSNGYYQQLISDLKLKQNFNSVDMADLEILWEDLCVWTKACNGEFGHFHKRKLGGYERIGVPASQSIVKPNDLERLPNCFLQAQVKPGLVLSEDKLTAIFDCTKASSNLFSKGFNEALNDAEFAQPIIGILRYAYSDWDGSVQKKYYINSDSSCSIKKETSANKIGLSLVINSDDCMSVHPRWLVPAIPNVGAFKLEHKNTSWSGFLYGTEAASTGSLSPYDEIVWKIAALGAIAEQQFNLKCVNEEDLNPNIFPILLPQTSLWVLVPIYDQLTGQLELRAGDLPAYGPAYLLAPPSTASLLKNYIKREQPAGIFVEIQGLPDDWQLYCISECSNLNIGQRLLPDGQEQAHPKPHPIRFIGGRSVKRAYTRMYLPYDLPIIELDAPIGTYLTSKEDIQFVEEIPCEISNINNVVKDALMSPKRRFLITLSTTNSATYEIKAQDAYGKLLGTMRLRVTGLGGDVVQAVTDFSIDEFGRHSVSKIGLQGVLFRSSENIGDIETKILINDALSCSDLGVKVTFDIEKSCIFRKFLDRVAQSGSLDYGSAKSLLVRLMQANNICIPPIFILLELRRIGLIEITTTNKGQTSRIHSVIPCLYSLPLVFSGKPVWAISGSLRLKHWQLIASETDAWSAYCNNSDSAGLQTWRLVINNQESAQELCDKFGFQLVHLPAAKIISWAGGMEAYKQQTLRNTIETIGETEDQPMRFIPKLGGFEKRPNGKLLDIWELWKLQDLDIRFDNVYVLAKNGQYSFVRDAAWAKWLAINEAAKKYQADFPSLQGIYPPPISYSLDTATVWIPAIVGLPTVLERALLLCSGRLAEIITLQKRAEPVLEDRISLISPNGAVLSFNVFYYEMIDGKWLVYHHVPLVVAQILADKLCATLDVIDQ